MACELCGRRNCTRSFHSLDEQAQFDLVADDIKERMRRIIRGQVNRLRAEDIEGNDHVKLSDVMSIIDSY